MTTKLVPLGNRVLLRRIESSTRGGLKLPQSVEGDEGTQEYEVVAMPDILAAAVKAALNEFKLGMPISGSRPAEVRFRFGVGARIYLARHKGFKIETSTGEELYVAEVDDILAVEVDA